MSSAGNLTNAILPYFKWISENAQSFVERSTFSVAQSTKLWFFDTLCALATGERFELIDVADPLKERLSDAVYQTGHCCAILGRISQAHSSHRVTGVMVVYVTTVTVVVSAGRRWGAVWQLHF